LPQAVDIFGDHWISDQLAAQLHILRERVPEFPLSFHGVLVGSVADTAVADVVDVVLGRHLLFSEVFEMTSLESL
jgi:hypothetical protein